MAYSFRLIDIDDANQAYADAVSKIRRLRARAAAGRKIAEVLDGAYISKRLDQELKRLFPEARTACIDKDTYCARKYVYVMPGNEYSYAHAWHFNIHKEGEKRINGALLKSNAERDEEEARQIEEGLVKFSALVCQYNALATAYAGIYDDLNTFFNDLIGADWSLRKH